MYNKIIKKTKERGLIMSGLEKLKKDLEEYVPERLWTKIINYK